MGFKFDAINKAKRVLNEIYKDNPHLYIYGQDDMLGYFKGVVPLLHEKLNKYEISVLIEEMCLNITGDYNEQYYKMKKLYDSVVLFKVDPEIVILEAFKDEIKGFSGIGGECSGDTSGE